MNIKTLFSAAVAVAVGGIHASALAGVIFVGSWQVDQGPHWSTQPLAYSGQEAAALLFGGTAADYAISTVDTDSLNIDHMAWYSVIGVGGGHKFAEDYSSKLPSGQYYDGAGYGNTLDGPASAYVSDNASGSTYTNYAFRITEDNGTDVPEPASLALLGSALLGFGVLRRRRR